MSSSVYYDTSFNTFLVLLENMECLQTNHRTTFYELLLDSSNVYQYK